MLKLICILLLLQKSLFALEINSKITFNELLSHSEIYIDHNRSENIRTIQNRKFEPNNEELLGFGYSPNFDVWIKFSLTNKTSHPIQKVIEYNNPLTSNVIFFEETILKKEDGLLNLSKDRISINPILEVTLKPHQSKQFFIKTSSKITTLIIRLNVWSSKAFYHKEMHNQIILALFFGAMFIIILYNTIIFTVTKELSYLYYVLFFTSVSFHHLMYKGIAGLYLFSSQSMVTLINYSSFIVAMPTIFLALFTQYILRLKQYPRLNKTLNYLLILYPIVIITIQITGAYQYRSLFFIIILIYLFFVTCYALIKKNEQARFIIVGWVLFVSSGVFMYLSSSGIYNVFKLYPYFAEFSLVFEIMVFSLALASKIKILNQEKLISQKRKFLLKELKHRIKNSMVTILSFVDLQIEKIEDRKTEKILENLENRIMATIDLYSLLHTEDNMIEVDMSEYLYSLTDEIKKSFEQESVSIDIKSDIKMNSKYAKYCGLIINEAVTSAFKHAFNSDASRGKIDISLLENIDNYYLTIKDNGCGFKKETKNSIGLDIIYILATKQLDGWLNIKKDNGVQIDITWRKDETKY